MTQEHRPTTFVDINYREHVAAPSGKERVSQTTWDPNRGAAAAVARIEAQARAEHQLELAKRNLDPTHQRLSGLEAAVQALNERLLRLEAGQ
jgi:hypothetical protein